MLKGCESFHKNKSRKNGYTNICKVCKKEMDREYRGKNMEECRIKNLKYKQDNKEKLRKQWNNYVDKNRKKYLVTKNNIDKKIKTKSEKLIRNEN